MEGEGAVVGCDVPARGKAGLDFLSDGIVSHQRIEKEADESSRGGIFRNQGVESGGFARSGIDEDTAPLSDLIAGCVDSFRQRDIFPGHLFLGRAGSQNPWQKNKRESPKHNGEDYGIRSGTQIPIS